MPMIFGILTVSDRCSSSETTDHSGPALQKSVKDFFPNAEVITSCIPDDYERIRWTLIDWCDWQKCNVVLTTGGTGFSPRDVTPEATRAILDKLAPAITQHINTMSMKVTPNALLSRAVCGIRKETIILNLPGSKKAALECFDFIVPVLTHAIELVLDNKDNVTKTHADMQSIKANSGSKVKVECAALRNRKSPYPMIPVSDALDIILQMVKTFNTEYICTEKVNINTSLGRVLAQNICSKTPLPPFPASTKDGYAVISSDGIGVREVREVTVAGDSPDKFTLKRGEIIRISTGAPVPNGADAVVQVEDTVLVQATDDNMKELKVKINVKPTIGLDIRPIGSDIPENTSILDQDDIITAAHIGVMAAIGVQKIQVHSRFSIGLLSSGNELLEYGQKLEPGRIFDSNKLTLINLLKQYNYEATDCGIARDDPNDIKRKMTQAFVKHDVLITTGGVSMGEYDLIKQVLLKDFDAEIHFGRVDMKPGKPTTFSTCLFNGRRKLIFALPGNPVSASVTCVLFVLPALQAKEYKSQRRNINVILDQDIILDSRPEYMRAQVISSRNGELHAKTTGNQISSRLNSLVGAHVLLILPGKTTERQKLPKGACVAAIKLDTFV